MIKVTFVTADGTEILVETGAGTTLMEAARNNGVSGILAECGGACSCSTCHVLVREEWLGKLDTMEGLEEALLDFAPERHTARSRLSCQIPLTQDLDGMVVDLPTSQL